LSDKPKVDEELIKFMNNRSKELNILNIEYRTSLVMEAKKVLAMKQPMQSIERKVHELTREIYSFKKIFKEVISFGLSGLWDGVRDLYPEKNYKKRLDKKRNDDSRFTKLE
jgi:hypothetical protein